MRMMVTPVMASPANSARCIGAAPRHRGKSEAWMLKQPKWGMASASAGKINPYATTTSASNSRLRSVAAASFVLKLVG